MYVYTDQDISVGDTESLRLNIQEALNLLEDVSLKVPGVVKVGGPWGPPPRPKRRKGSVWSSPIKGPISRGIADQLEKAVEVEFPGVQGEFRRHDPGKVKEFLKVKREEIRNSKSSLHYL